MTEDGGNCLYNLCNISNNYPYETVRKLLQENKQYASLFIDESIDKQQERWKRSSSEIYSECELTNTILMPKIAYDTDNTRRIIVNNEDYRQEVSISLCQ